MAITLQNKTVYLLREDADINAFRRGTHPQTLRVYNKYNNSTNYERGFIRWNANVLDVGTEYAGTGTQRSLSFYTGGVRRWIVDSVGMLVASTDNAYDIGAVAATRPRTLFCAQNVHAGSSNYFGFASDGSARAKIWSPADGVLTITNNLNTDFTRLQFGGTDNTFPALARSASTIKARLADDSGNANLEAGSLVYDGSLVPNSVLGQKVLLSAVAPTIGSGFGTSPSIVVHNGTAAFTVNVGTGGTASSGVITMPAAQNGWVAFITNVTANAANRANVDTVQTASTTNSITIQSQTISTGAATAWAANDILRIIAFAY